MVAQYALAQMSVTKKHRRRPYVLSLRGYGTDVRLDIDRAAARRLLAWIGQDFGEWIEFEPTPVSSPAPPPPAPTHREIEVVSTAHMEPDARHAFHHEHAPEALRSLYRELCDQLLDDAQIALDEEKRRRSTAS